jgi:predicted GNAT family acetyltransferase
MTADSSSVPIRHNPAASRFETIVDGHLSVADYVLAGNRMIFTHTFVPDALRGRGIAAALVGAALEEARVAGRKVEPRCSYVAAYIDRHPEYRDLVA